MAIAFSFLPALQYVATKDFRWNYDFAPSIELAIHREFYRNHPVLRGAKIQFNSARNGVGTLPIESLFDLTCFNSESEGVFNKESFEAAFKNEVTATSMNYTYSGTLKIMGLASVFGLPLETLYPEQKDKLLPVYQNTFLPRTGTYHRNRVIRIMWTNTNGWPDRSKEFKVNHFVPLLRNAMLIMPLRSGNLLSIKEGLQKEEKNIRSSEPANNSTLVKPEGAQKYNKGKFKIHVKSERMVKRKRVEGNFKLSKGSTAQQNGTKLTTSDEDSQETDIEREKEENESKNTTKQ